MDADKMANPSRESRRTVMKQADRGEPARLAQSDIVPRPSNNVLQPSPSDDLPRGRQVVAAVAPSPTGPRARRDVTVPTALQ